MDNLSFYVFDNLRLGAPGMPNESNIYRFSDLGAAIDKFRELPDELTTALGCRVGGPYEIDLLHKINGEPVRVNDFYSIERFNSVSDVHNAMAKIEEKLGIKYQYLSGLIPGSSVLCPIEPIDREYFDARGKVLLPEKGTNNLLSSINELYVEGRGWMERDSFYNEFKGKNYFRDPTRPIVTTINVNYMNLQNGEHGQRDLSPCCFNRMVEATKAYEQKLKTHAEKESPLDDKIDKAEEEANKIDSKDDIDKEVEI